MRSSRLRESKSGIKHYSHILFWKSTDCLNLVAGFHGRLPLINYDRLNGTDIVALTQKEESGVTAKTKTKLR